MTNFTSATAVSASETTASTRYFAFSAYVVSAAGDVERIDGLPSSSNSGRLAWAEALRPRTSVTVAANVALPCAVSVGGSWNVSAAAGHGSATELRRISFESDAEYSPPSLVGACT